MELGVGTYGYAAPVRRPNIATQNEANVPKGSLWWIWMLSSGCRYLLTWMYVCRRPSVV